MSNDDNRVLIDTDFLNHIMESKSTYEEGLSVFKTIFEELGVVPCTHRWVASNEMISSHLRKLVSDGHVKIIEWTDIIHSKGEEKLYESNFCGLYERKEHKTLELNNCPITEYRSAGSSLGEIHLSLAAKELGIPLICSDDGGTKKLAKMMSDDSFTLKVHTLGEVLQKTSKNPDTSISYNECQKMLTYLKARNKQRYTEEIDKIHNNYLTNSSRCQ